VKFTWPESVRKELLAVERQTAVRILQALTEYGDSGVGDVKMLIGQWQGTGDFVLAITVSCSLLRRTRSPLFEFGIDPNPIVRFRRS
jgi:hypothetical protein